MNSLVNRYVSRLFLGRFFVLLLGLAALMLVLDFLADGDKVIRHRGDLSIFGAVARYGFYRMPEYLSVLIPFTALVAGLLTFTRLSRLSELTVMRAAGISTARLIGSVMPGALLIAVLQFIVNDQAVPAGIGALRAWGVGDYADSSSEDAANLIWLRQGTDIVRIRHVDDDRGTMDGVTIFQRDDKGLFVAKITAVSATFGSSGWILNDVTRSAAGSAAAEKWDHLGWPSIAAPSVVATAAVHPREMPVARLLSIRLASGFGNQPRYLYEIWTYKRLSKPVLTILMVMLTVVLVNPLARQGSGGWWVVGGAALGSLLWTFDDLIFSLGEYGLLPPFAAAWAPATVFVAVVLGLILHHESHRRGRPV